MKLILIPHTFTGSTMNPSLCKKNRRKILLFGLRVPWSGDNSFKFKCFHYSIFLNKLYQHVTALSTLPSVAHRSQKPWIQTKGCIWYLTKLWNINMRTCCTTMLLRQIYVASKNKMGLGLHLQLPMLHWTKQCLFAQGLLQMHNLAKWIAMAGKVLHSLSVFVSITVKHFVISDRIMKQ